MKDVWKASKKRQTDKKNRIDVVLVVVVVGVIKQQQLDPLSSCDEGIICLLSRRRRKIRGKQLAIISKRDFPTTGLNSSRIS